MIYHIYLIFELFYKVKINLLADMVSKKNRRPNWCKDELRISLTMVSSSLKELNWARLAQRDWQNVCKKGDVYVLHSKGWKQKVNWKKYGVKRISLHALYMYTYKYAHFMIILIYPFLILAPWRTLMIFVLYF